MDSIDKYFTSVGSDIYLAAMKVNLYHTQNKNSTASTGLDYMNQYKIHMCLNNFNLRKYSVIVATTFTCTKAI